MSPSTIALKTMVRVALVSIFALGLTTSVLAKHGAKEDGVTGLKLKAGKGRVLIVSGVIANTPAALVGLRVGDTIVAVEGHAINKLSLKKAVGMFRGAPGTKLQLSIKRGKASPFDIIITRAPPAPAKSAKTSSTASALAVTSTTETSSVQ
jgi:C-terminal processing protease CtpA/Prc